MSNLEGCPVISVSAKQPKLSKIYRPYRIDNGGLTKIILNIKYKERAGNKEQKKNRSGFQ